MREYLVDDRLVFDSRNHTGLAAADSASLYIDVEYSLESLGPSYGQMTVGSYFLLVL